LPSSFGVALLSKVSMASGMIQVSSTSSSSGCPLKLRRRMRSDQEPLATLALQYSVPKSLK
jgi:hypothetical protein